jgi:hypothetical protein
LDKFDGTKKRLLNKINALLKRESENTILIQAITEDGKQIEENVIILFRLLLKSKSID